MTVIPTIIEHLDRIQKLGKKTGRVGNQRTCRDHPDFSIVEIGQNSEKSPGNLKKLAVTQTPGKDPNKC